MYFNLYLNLNKNSNIASCENVFNEKIYKAVLELYLELVLKKYNTLKLHLMIFIKIANLLSTIYVTENSLLNELFTLFIFCAYY